MLCVFGLTQYHLLAESNPLIEETPSLAEVGTYIGFNCLAWACALSCTQGLLGETQEKPAGQIGSSGDPGGDHAVLFWQYYVENSRAVCCDAIRRNGGPVVVLLGYAHPCRFRRLNFIHPQTQKSIKNSAGSRVNYRLKLSRVWLRPTCLMGPLKGTLSAAQSRRRGASSD